MENRRQDDYRIQIILKEIHDIKDRFNEYKEESNERVSELRLTIGRIVSHLESEREDRAAFGKMLHGTESAPGLDKRVDRLEQRDEDRKKHFLALWFAILTGIGAQISRWIFRD